MALVSSCAELQPFGVKDTDGMGDKQQKPVPRAAAAYGRQLKMDFKVKDKIFLS